MLSRRITLVISRAVGNLRHISGRNSKGDMIWKAAATGNEEDRGLKKHVDVVKERIKDKMDERGSDVLDQDDGLNAQLEEAKDRSARALSRKKANDPEFEKMSKQVMAETERKGPETTSEQRGEVEKNEDGRGMDELREKIKEEVDSIHTPAEELVSSVGGIAHQVANWVTSNVDDDDAITKKTDVYGEEVARKRAEETGRVVGLQQGGDIEEGGDDQWVSELQESMRSNVRNIRTPTEEIVKDVVEGIGSVGDWLGAPTEDEKNRDD